MKPSLQMQFKQTLKLSPKLQWAIKLLQLSTYELEVEIKAALETNPLLEINYDLDETATYVPISDAYDIESYIYAETSLQDYLLWQMNLTPFNNRDQIIAITLIDSINEDGYLKTDVTEILQVLQNNHGEELDNLELDEVQAVLRRIQQFDPPGVGARNLSECMLLQLQTLGLNFDLNKQCESLIINHLDLLGQKNFKAIKEHLQVNQDQLNIIIAHIKRLQPKPGALVSTTKTEYIVPDVIVEKVNNTWHVSLKSHLAQSLRINANYAQLMSQAKNEFDNAALRKQYTEAQWLLDSIKNRNITLLNVASYIVRYQNEFMEHGEAKMRPLILQDIGMQLGLSESTISRITSRKYMHTPRGTYELKYFFSSHVATGNGDCSSTAVKAIIKQLIGQENSAQPLSDQELTTLIRQHGINIARRTVAKYREALGIHPSNLRGT